jgi:hypothetical protein
VLFIINIKSEFPLVESITAPTMFRKGLPRIIDILSSSGISNTTDADGVDI